MQHISEITTKLVVARNKQLTETLEKLMALYRIETGLIGFDNPITLEAERLVGGGRKRA